MTQGWTQYLSQGPNQGPMFDPGSRKQKSNSLVIPAESWWSLGSYLLIFVIPDETVGGQLLITTFKGGLLKEYSSIDRGYSLDQGMQGARLEGNTIILQRFPSYLPCPPHRRVELLLAGTPPSRQAGAVLPHTSRSCPSRNSLAPRLRIVSEKVGQVQSSSVEFMSR